MSQTVVGFSPPQPESRFRGTMIGIAPPTTPETSAPPQPGPTPPGAQGPGMRQTMIGIAPLGPAGQAPGQSAPSTPSVPAAPPGFGQTQGYPTPPPPPETGPRPAAGMPAPQIVSHQKTVIGVARPGIAPLNPGQAKQAPPAPTPSTVVMAPSAGGHPSSGSLPSAGGAGAVNPGPSAQGAPASGRSARNAPPKQGIPALAAVSMVGAAGLFAAAAVVWLFYRGHGSIEARATAQADGKEQLELSCSACDDGTVVRLDAANATFSGHHASLPLSRPLKVGENPMTLTLVAVRGKQSFVDISVPIAYRVRGDTSGLDAPTPELRVLVNAVAGSTVTVDGKPVTLNAEGEGRYVLDVSAEVTGLDANVKTLERKLSYTVTPPNGTPQTGSVSLQAGITPLVIDAPGPAVLLETSNFVLAGRTAKAGTLTVSDRPITVDATGRFAQMMNVSAPGETTIVIRATSKDTAPRLFPLRVKRVDSLQREAERVRQRATSNYAAIADQAETKRGWAVALDGATVDARTENYNTVVVMDVQGGCVRPPCLARVTYGAPFSLAAGDKFSAFGEVVGLVDGPRSGSKIPEIRADFLLKATK
ncbi:MAG TPA: hypothetical protein VER96_07300 [Polyangiaceae bacterium]|nr:hypothetical protein [Polyangiaceae bacterium]